jgi:hypothetical protein
MNQLQRLIEQKLETTNVYDKEFDHIIAASNFLGDILDQEQLHLPKEREKDELLYHLEQVGDEKLIGLAKQI